jgi:hypothetical protein
MTDVVSFGAGYIAAVQNLVQSMESLRLFQARFAQDSALFTEYLASPNARTDIVAADLTACNASVTQVLFAFDSGSPPQKAALFKLL